MNRIFLLRAYGDFVILLQAILRSNTSKNYSIVASSHLKPLYLALCSFKDMSQLQIEFIDFGINKGQLRLFTNRHFLHFETLKELKKIRQFVEKNPNRDGVDFIEQDIRIDLLNWFTRSKFQSMIHPEAIYENYDAFFSNDLVSNESKKPVQKIAIFPDARIAKRIIPIHTIQKIKNTINTQALKFEVIRFKKKVEESDLLYENFNQLIGFIQQADLIIGADSLPIHLAQFFQKKHFMFFPEGGLTNFLTPYAKSKISYGNFNQFNISL